jgi:integrase
VLKHYRRPDGTPTSEQQLIRQALRPLRRLYGHTLARDFGPLALKAVRTEIITHGCGKVPREGGPPLARKVADQHTGRIVRLFKWGVGEELLAETIWRALTAVPQLEPGRSPARETDEVTPPPQGSVEAMLPHATLTVRAMVLFQCATGARPGEVASLRPQDLDTTGDTVAKLLKWPVEMGTVWAYLPGLEVVRGRFRQGHKTAHHQIRRVIPVGQAAQDLLAPLLQDLAPGDYVFSPAKSRAESDLRRREARQTPVQPSQRDRSKKGKRPRAGECFTGHGYNQAIFRACTRAIAAAIRGARATVVILGQEFEGVKQSPIREAMAAAEARGVQVTSRPEAPEVGLAIDGRPSPAAYFHAHQLRHLAATLLERDYGIEVAQAVCGHTTTSMTRRYVVENVEKAFRAIEQRDARAS